MIGKKAQVGKTIASLPIFFVVIFMMAGFLVLVAFASFVRGPGEIEPFRFSESYNNVLLKNIEVNGKKMSILNFYLNEELFNQNTELMHKRLEEISTETKSCIILAKGLSLDPYGGLGGQARDDFYVEFKDGVSYSVRNSGNVPLHRLKYSEHISPYEFKFESEKSIYVDAFIGECANE